MKKTLSAISSGIKLSVLSALFVIAASCGGDSDDSLMSGSGSGLAPDNLTGKTIVFTTSAGSQLISVEHLSSSGLVVNDATVDYAKYPPSYRYVKRGTNMADYSLNVTKVTFVPYYGTNHYSKFSFDFDLSFSAGGYNRFTGTQTNANGVTSYISGTFKISD